MTGFEPLIAAATAGLASLITETIKSSGGKTLGIFDYDLGQNIKETIFQASGAYIKKYTERHGIVKVLGMREPVTLESIYTTVQLLDDEGLRSFQSVEELEKSFWKIQRHAQFTKIDNKREGIDIANDKQYLMVLGAPGSGKSTFIRKIGLEALKGRQGNLNHSCVPVLIELKKFVETQVDIKTFIRREFEICGFPNPEKVLKSTLERGKLLILFDGLDEVPSANLSNAIQAIEDFVDRYHKNRYIVSCRIAAYQHNFRRFTDVVIAEFNDRQIQQFIRNWFQSRLDQDANTAENCWSLLKTPENLAAKELAHTPLLLTFLCLVYERSQNFPDNRSTLYKKALRILLEEWAGEKRILREEIYEGLNTELEEILLSEIAYRSLTQERLFLPKSDIVYQIREFLSTNLNAPKSLSGEKVLDAVAVQQGILVERAEDIYSFSHLTLQEYLVALYIKENRKMIWMVEYHILDNRWREVFLLAAGLMQSQDGADPLLLVMSFKAETYINTPKLRAIFQWMKELVSSSNSISTMQNNEILAKKALALHWLVFFEQTRALNRINTNQHSRVLSLTLAIINNLTSKINVDSNLPDALELASASDLDLDIEHILELSQYYLITEANALRTSLTEARRLVGNAELIEVRTWANSFAKNFDKVRQFVDVLVRDFALTASRTPGQTISNLIGQYQIRDFKARTNRLIQSLKDALKHPMINSPQSPIALRKELDQAIRAAENFLENLNGLGNLSKESNFQESNLSQNFPQTLNLVLTTAQETSHVLRNAVDQANELGQQYVKEINRTVEELFILARSNAREIVKKLSSSSDSILSLGLSLDNALESAHILDQAFANKIYEQEVYLATSGREYCLELVRSLKRAIDLAIDLSPDNRLILKLSDLRKRSLHPTQGQEDRQSFIEELWKMCLDAFDINFDLINIPQQEMESLENYLHAIHLMIKCKKSSVKVSPQVWERIELSLLSLKSTG